MTAHDQRAEFWNKIDNFLFAQSGLDRDLERALSGKFIHSTLGNGIGDQDFW